jgi:hypothetical protein
MEQSLTSFDNKAGILSSIWTTYRLDSGFAEFIEYNDLGLPLAFAYSEGIVEFKNSGSSFIEETFDLLMATLDIEDEGFETLDDVLERASR